MWGKPHRGFESHPLRHPLHTVCHRPAPAGRVLGFAFAHRPELSLPPFRGGHDPPAEQNEVSLISIRPARERGRTLLDWLDSRHSFSFGDYHDPQHMGFGHLRVINEDRVRPGGGFATHGHRDMEILSFVFSGALEHKDSLGSGSVIRPGDVQRMTAGTGVTHSEFNPSSTEPVHLLQVWILPERGGLNPGYEQTTVPAQRRRDRLCVVASRDGRDGSVTIHQDATVYAALLSAGGRLTHPIVSGRRVWVQVAGGAITLNETRLAPGDGAAVVGETELALAGREESEVLLFDLA